MPLHLSQLQLQTPSALSSCNVPEDLAQVATDYRYAKYTRQLSWNTNSKTVEPDRSQRDRPAACVIAQQYSSAKFVSLLSHSRNEKIGALKTSLFQKFVFFLSVGLKLRSWAVSCFPHNPLSNALNIYSPFRWDTKFHTHITQVEKLQFCIGYS